MGELFDGHEDASRLGGQTFYLSEFLNRHAEGWSPPRVGGKALVHVHCHHKSVIGKEDEIELLRKMGVEVREPEPGCCGLAGSFGFEAGHYDVSMAVGEQRLLPAVRAAETGERLIANGFSCQTQIEQGTGREARHLAEVIAAVLPNRPAPVTRGRRRSGALTGAIAAGGAVLATDLLLRALGRGRGPQERLPSAAVGHGGRR